MKLNKLSEDYTRRLLGRGIVKMPDMTKSAIEAKLETFGLLDKDDANPVVELPLPDWLPTATEAVQQASGKYKYLLERLDQFALADVPELPEYQQSDKRYGWQRHHGTRWMPSEPPSNQTMVLDFETVKIGDEWLPACCVAWSTSGWWLWWNDLTDLDRVVKFGTNNLVIGHNVSYDRAYLETEYSYQRSGNYFFDTMSAWIAVRGFTNQQRGAYLKYANGSEDDDSDDDRDSGHNLYDKWLTQTTVNSLSSVYSFYYPGEYLDKSERASIEEFGLDHYRVAGVEITRYCIKDVVSTFKVFTNIYPENRLAQPSEASRVGQLLLGNTWLPLSADRFPKYVDSASAVAKKQNQKINQAISEAVQQTLENPTEHQLEHLDWTPAKSGKNKGQPAWYRACKGKPTVKSRITPILLKVCWLGELVYFTEDQGWRTSSTSVPHPEKRDKKVTSLFMNKMIKFAENGALSAPGLQDILVGLISLVNWTSLEKRVRSMKTENLEGYPVVLPQIAVTGTTSRRCADNIWQVATNPKKSRVGTELKSMVEAPQGYRIVGADVDQEELWLAAALGDTVTGYCGSTALSYSTLIGRKEDKSDPHSIVASSVGASRDTGKIVMYGSIYGMGVKGLTDTLLKNNPELTQEEAYDKASSLLNTLKGSKYYNEYAGGMGSESFNVMERIANQQQPVSPILGAKLTKALAGVRDYATSRVNWVVQTSGSDFRDLYIVLVDWLIGKFQLDARLLMSIHDEFRYVCKETQTTTMAYVLQLAHLLVRAYITKMLALDCIPAGIAWHSAVDVDTVLRKDPADPQVTPSQPCAIAAGYSLTAQELLQLL